MTWVAFQLTHPWGCDAEIIYNSYRINISTHTPVRVWRAFFSFSWRLIHFNSHTREGVTSHGTSSSIGIKAISTHTPVRVWRDVGRTKRKKQEFQLTHPWGCDSVVELRAGEVLAFQLTHPWGCDYHIRYNWVTFGFQLTHPWGCDLRLLVFLVQHFYFNSHTREGVTRLAIEMSYRYGIFQLTHPWGCDPKLCP